MANNSLIWLAGGKTSRLKESTLSNCFSRLFRNVGRTGQDDGKRLKRLEVSREVIRRGVGGGGADLQVLGLQNGVEEVQKTL